MCHLLLKHWPPSYIAYLDQSANKINYDCAHHIIYCGFNISHFQCYFVIKIERQTNLRKMKRDRLRLRNLVAIVIWNYIGIKAILQQDA